MQNPIYNIGLCLGNKRKHEKPKEKPERQWQLFIIDRTGCNWSQHRELRDRDVNKLELQNKCFWRTS